MSSCVCGGAYPTQVWPLHSELCTGIERLWWDECCMPKSSWIDNLLKYKCFNNYLNDLFMNMQNILC